MSMSETIALALVTSTTVGGLFAFAIKQYLQRAIDLRFKPLEHALQLELAERKKLIEALIDKRVGVYPEILEVTYRLRKFFESGLKAKSALLWDQDIPNLVHRLYELLFTTRAYLPENVFADLHEYKRLSQDIVQVLDVLTRGDNGKNRELYVANLPMIEERVRLAQELYLRIEAALSFRAEPQ